MRLNIRPFVLAGALRGRNPEGSERINDRHFTVAEKQVARAAVGTTA